MALTAVVTTTLSPGGVYGTPFSIPARTAFAVIPGYPYPNPGITIAYVDVLIALPLAPSGFQAGRYKTFLLNEIGVVVPGFPELPESFGFFIRIYSVKRRNGVNIPFTIYRDIP